jgi:hypothetical protein
VLAQMMSDERSGVPRRTLNNKSIGLNRFVVGPNNQRKEGLGERRVKKIYQHKIFFLKIPLAYLSNWGGKNTIPENVGKRITSRKRRWTYYSNGKREMFNCSSSRVGEWAKPTRMGQTPRQRENSCLIEVRKPTRGGFCCRWCVDRLGKQQSKRRAMSNNVTNSYSGIPRTQPTLSSLILSFRPPRISLDTIDWVQLA